MFLGKNTISAISDHQREGTPSSYHASVLNKDLRFHSNFGTNLCTRQVLATECILLGLAELLGWGFGS